ncbi:hypothetical protein R5H30_11460 [Sulfitobacter sp. D35]|uniref:hypothetical protein n=1 Tax=Sulfitobacter sp. D35 TaxID=3083252 RepID=UPI00296EE3D4|nr:hypothetical protein [Sulfitobacter sp. D35]MDW4498602.1 hypothetical protein [Sulfitobacter sp. D35]
MDPELALVLGIVLAVFTIPSLLSAMSDSRAPRASALTILIAVGLIFYAISQAPGPGYRMQDIPNIFVSVAGRYLP